MNLFEICVDGTHIKATFSQKSDPTFVKEMKSIPAYGI